MTRQTPANSAGELPAALVRQILETAALPLERAATLPKEVYLDEGFFEFEAREILAREWLCVAHVSRLKQAGDYVALDLLGEPLLAVRGKDDQVRVLSRVCPHRGVDILHSCFGEPRAGTTRSLRCPYHAWVFDFDGSLLAAPEMQRAEGFRPADWRLPALRSAIWQGFVFVNLSGDAEPLAELYAQFAERVAPWELADMEVAIELDWECEFNWKVMIENWTESYHHLGAHHDTLQLSAPARTTWTEPAHPHYIHCHLPFRPRLVEEIGEAHAQGRRLPGFAPVPGLSVEQQAEWGLFLGYPCFMLLTMYDRALWYRLEPLSAGCCRLKTMTLVRREALDEPDYPATLESETKMLIDFHLQDMQVNTAVQQGLHSRHAVRGRLSHLEEPVWLIQRYLAGHLRRHAAGVAA